eukprot:3422095-Alexandrium_andersonii.AAC.1
MSASLVGSEMCIRDRREERGGFLTTTAAGVCLSLTSPPVPRPGSPRPAACLPSTWAFAIAVVCGCCVEAG